jgi:hypothetical protein
VHILIQVIASLLQIANVTREYNFEIISGTFEVKVYVIAEIIQRNMTTLCLFDKKRCVMYKNYIHK